MEDSCYILKEYIHYYEDNVKKFGENTIVLMAVGKFYEIYSVINDEIKKGPDIYYFSDILGIQVSRRNKSIDKISFDNYLMSGFPIDNAQKFIKILLNYDYTIVLVDQVTEPPNPEREITKIISPGTSIENYNSSDTNYLLSVYISKYNSDNRDIYSLGISAIDISTGKNSIHSIRSNKYDNDIWSDELFRIIHFYNPSEIIFHVNQDDLELSISEISNRWSLKSNIIHYNCYSHTMFFKPSYQNEVLKKIFPNTGFLTPVEYLGIEREIEMIYSYLFMVQFIHEHKFDTIRELPKPEIKEVTHNLLLSHNCIYQLYLVPNRDIKTGKNDSLLSIVNNCKTPIGRRICKDRLLYPIIDSKKLQDRYEMIRLFLKKDGNNYYYQNIIPYLTKIFDIEKLHRRMYLQMLTPYEFYTLHISYMYINKIVEQLKIYDISHEFNSKYDKFTDYQNTYLNTFEMKELEKYSLTNMNTSIFKRDKYPEIDKLQDTIEDCDSKIKQICEKLGFYIDRKKSNVVKYECNDKYGYHIYITETRSKNLKKAINNLSNTSINMNFFMLELKDIQMFKRGSNVHLEFDYLTELCDKLLLSQRKLQSLNKNLYLEFIDLLTKDYSFLLSDIVDYVGFVDLNCNLGKLSIENCYCFPEIIHSDKSFIEAEQIRHPIVEKIQTELEYIPNDIKLSEDGILLFGTNACGKSTLMKSVGLSLIMAQAGFPVSCKSFKFSPYTQIFTRILNNDNIFKRQSSFAVEMSELRGILKRSNSKSLILGDEICSGTETVSALSIVSAGLKKLSDISCSFIFTSHLHQLMEIQLVQNISNLQVKHLKIHYDKQTNQLIYDRKLEDGSGPAIYGLEVCDAMDLGSEFVSLARSVQIEITNDNKNIINTKKSNYNTDIKMDLCAICKDKSEHTHHINEQQYADSNNIINHYHKNIQHNLVALCEKCHYKVHNDNLEIYGYHQTSEGIQLNYKFTDSIKPKRKKYDEKTLDIINQYKKDIIDKKLKKTTLINKLELEHDIRISVTTLTKIYNDDY